MYAALGLLAASQALAEPVTFTTRLRRDAALISDALARVRRQLWSCLSALQPSGQDPGMVTVSRPVFASLVERLGYAVWPYKAEFS